MTAALKCGERLLQIEQHFGYPLSVPTPGHAICNGLVGCRAEAVDTSYLVSQHTHIEVSEPPIQADPPMNLVRVPFPWKPLGESGMQQFPLKPIGHLRPKD